MKKLKYLKFITLSTLLTLSLTACGSTVKETKEQTPNNDQKQSQVEKKLSPVVYTANEGGTVSKIDGTTYEVLSTIKNEGSPHNVQISPDGKVVAFTSAVKMEEGKTEHGSMNIKGSALFYDVETDKLIKKVQVGVHPAHIVFTEDGKYVLVTNNDDNNVSIIDTKDYKLVKNVSTGKGPHGFRISADSKYAYIANMAEDTVSVIDIVNAKELKKIKVGKNPVTTGITRDGSILAVTLNGENAVAIVNLDTDKMDKVAVGAGPAQLYIDPNDRIAFVANQGTKEKPSNTVSKVDLEQKKVIATIEVGKGAHGIVTSADNKYILVTNMYEDTVSVIDINKDDVTKTIKVGDEPNGISVRQ